MDAPGRDRYLQVVNAIAFDTHALVKELTAAGFTEGQAEAVTAVVRRTRETDLSELATKSDLAVLRAEIKVDVATLDSRISKSGNDITRWVIGMIGFQALSVLAGAVAVAKLLH